MNINFRIMTPDEAWYMICNYHNMYHSFLKPFVPSHEMFIPQWTFLDDMFSIPNPSPEQIELWRNKFMHGYNAKQLHAKDSVLENAARPALEHVAKTLAPFAKNWGIKIPDEITILTTYGNGASYSAKRNRIILLATRMRDGSIAKVLQHELVHIIIENDIIQRYHVPQDLKERIVDIICQEYFGKEPQPNFINSFANKYITRAEIESDLPGAVKKMMADYTLLNQKMANTKSI